MSLSNLREREKKTKTTLAHRIRPMTCLTLKVSWVAKALNELKLHDEPLPETKSKKLAKKPLLQRNSLLLRRSFFPKLLGNSTHLKNKKFFIRYSSSKNVGKAFLGAVDLILLDEAGAGLASITGSCSSSSSATTSSTWLNADIFSLTASI